jgi:hypothetical protein
MHWKLFKENRSKIRWHYYVAGLGTSLIWENSMT